MLKDLIAPPIYRKAHLMNEAAGYDIVDQKEPKRVAKLLECALKMIVGREQ
jgi:hypothetical protein